MIIEHNDHSLQDPGHTTECLGHVDFLAIQTNMTGDPGDLPITHDDYHQFFIDLQYNYDPPGMDVGLQDKPPGCDSPARLVDGHDTTRQDFCGQLQENSAYPMGSGE
jgi:hypothetical protein